MSRANDFLGGREEAIFILPMSIALFLLGTFLYGAGLSEPRGKRLRIWLMAIGGVAFGYDLLGSALPELAPPPGCAAVAPAPIRAVDTGGMTSFDDARRRFRRRGGPAHLLVRHRGTTVIDERLGVGPDAAFWPFSVSKLWIATLIWALHDDGALDVDDRVADHWPEFGRHGKRATILDVLRHRSGVPRAGSTLAEVAAMTDWRRATAAIAAAPPIRRHDAKPAYEWLAWGFILGEVARRGTGLPAEALPELLRGRILDPLGADGTSLGLARADAWRAVPFTARDPSSATTAAVLNLAAVRRAIIPAGGVSTRAVDLVALLDAIGAGGAPLGMRPATVARMLAPSNRGEFDRYAGSRVWWANGVQLGHPGPRAFAASAFGRRSSPRAFGHNGSNVSIAWHDPDRDLTFVHLSGLIEPFPVNRLRLMALEDAVIAAADARP